MATAASRERARSGVQPGPGCWAGPGGRRRSPHTVLPAASAASRGAARPGHGGPPAAWWTVALPRQVQHGRWPHLEHLQLQQHPHVCGRAAERAGRGDAGHHVSALGQGGGADPRAGLRGSEADSTRTARLPAHPRTHPHSAPTRSLTAEVPPTAAAGGWALVPPCADTPLTCPGHRGVDRWDQESRLLRAPPLPPPELQFLLSPPSLFSLWAAGPCEGRVGTRHQEDLSPGRPVPGGARPTSAV